GVARPYPQPRSCTETRAVRRRRAQGRPARSGRARPRAGAGSARRHAAGVQGGRGQGGAHDGRDRNAPQRHGRGRAGPGSRRHRGNGGTDQASRRSAGEHFAAAAAKLTSGDPRSMRLPELCIRRPVFATVLSLVILLLGFISYQRLPVREYPNIDEPVVTVTTTYTGASPEIGERQVTRTLEESGAGIEGIEVRSSTSRAEGSQITIRSKLIRNPDAAAADVRDRVGRVRDQLPDEIDEPVIAKVEADAQPILY